MDLSRGNGGGGDDDQMSLENSGCLYAVGGGETEEGGSLAQPKIISEKCIAVFEEYFKEVPFGAQMWLDVISGVRC